MRAAWRIAPDAWDSYATELTIQTGCKSCRRTVPDAPGQFSEPAAWGEECFPCAYRVKSRFFIGVAARKITVLALVGQGSAAKSWA